LDNLPRNAEERALKRFEREAKEVARLNHPNIVKVTDYGEHEGSPYLVMPYLPGGTLSGKLSAGGRLDWKTAANLLIPIADALEYAHEQRIIHRDVKPSNILFTSTGVPMLADFGVAKVIDEEVTQDLTGTSATVGTPEYMAPEQIRSKSVDQRVDVYSLGVVYYEMVTGSRPFRGDTPIETLFKHASEPLTRPSRLVPDLPPDVEDFLIKALMKNPAERFASMAAMSAAWRLMVSGTAPWQVAQPPTTPAPTLPQLNQAYGTFDQPGTTDQRSTPNQPGSRDSYGTVDQPGSIDVYGTQDQSFSTDQGFQAAPFDRPIPAPPQIAIAPPQVAIAPPWIPPVEKKSNPLGFILGGIIALGIVVTLIVVVFGGAGNRRSTYSSYSYEPAAQSDVSASNPSVSKQGLQTPHPSTVQQSGGNSQNSYPVATQPSKPSVTPTVFRCPGLLPSRIKVGDKVTVCTKGNLRMRETPAPKTSTDFIRQFPSGTKLKVIDGPVCDYDSTWWLMLYDDSKKPDALEDQGWMKETEKEREIDYYLCPDNAN